MWRIDDLYAINNLYVINDLYDIDDLYDINDLYGVDDLYARDDLYGVDDLHAIDDLYGIVSLYVCIIRLVKLGTYCTYVLYESESELIYLMAVNKCTLIVTMEDVASIIIEHKPFLRFTCTITLGYRCFLLYARSYIIKKL